MNKSNTWLNQIFVEIKDLCISNNCPNQTSKQNQGDLSNYDERSFFPVSRHIHSLPAGNFFEHFHSFIHSHCHTFTVTLSLLQFSRSHAIFTVLKSYPQTTIEILFEFWKCEFLLINQFIAMIQWSGGDLVINIFIIQCLDVPQVIYTDPLGKKHIRRAKLNLVDLAGRWNYHVALLPSNS